MRLTPAPSQYHNQVLIEMVSALDWVELCPTAIPETERDRLLLAAARLVARIAADDRKAFDEARYHDAAHLIYAPDKPGML